MSRLAELYASLEDKEMDVATTKSEVTEDRIKIEEAKAEVAGVIAKVDMKLEEASDLGVIKEGIETIAEEMRVLIDNNTGLC